MHFKYHDLLCVRLSSH